jgi:hypothetical protein
MSPEEQAAVIEDALSEVQSEAGYEDGVPACSDAALRMVAWLRSHGMSVNRDSVNLDGDSIP